MYSIKHLGNNIFLLQFESRYDLALHFVRAQEYYESPNPKFRGQIFDIWDYMEWYSKGHNNNFTYATDWEGFNVPGKVLCELYEKTITLPGLNKYDYFMKNVCDFIAKQLNGDNFYLIGATFDENSEAVIKHEIAHALWALSKKYREEQTENIKQSNQKTINKLKNNIMELGYTEDVLDDEVQAFLSVKGKEICYKGIEKQIEKIQDQFVKTYESFTDDTRIDKSEKHINLYPKIY